MKNAALFFGFIFCVSFVNAQFLLNPKSTAIHNNLDCEEELSIIETVFSGEIDNQSSKNAIYAYNILDGEATANYDAGLAVYLKTGFHAKTSSNFRAFIEGCEDESLSILENFVDSVKIYPNPTKGLLKITTLNKVVSYYSIINPLGKTIIKSKKPLSQEYIDLKNFSSGIYFLKIVSNSGEITIKKIIKI